MSHFNGRRRTFEARYPGHCDECDEPIEPGDMIGYSEFDEICCADCLEDDQG